MWADREIGFTIISLSRLLKQPIISTISCSTNKHKFEPSSLSCKWISTSLLLEPKLRTLVNYSTWFSLYYLFNMIVLRSETSCGSPNWKHSISDSTGCEKRNGNHHYNGYIFQRKYCTPEIVSSITSGLTMTAFKNIYPAIRKCWNIPTDCQSQRFMSFNIPTHVNCTNFLYKSFKSNLERKVSISFRLLFWRKVNLPNSIQHRTCNTHVPTHDKRGKVVPY